ncbi:hypothetical protein Q5752_003005 [Cryptotrichosporon argae]
MADDLKTLGTLIVVVGKARNLPNKSRFGKQDPFCTVVVGEDKQKTKPIKRGGQHPEWDEELRFTILEDIDDMLVRSESASEVGSLSSSVSKASLADPAAAAPGVVTPASMAKASRRGPNGQKGGKSMRVACYADDVKEPEFIGECVVPIDEVLKKGEVDEWYDLQCKEKYSGEVYLELTFYSNAAPPVKRNVPRPAVIHYGGAPAGVINPSASASRLSLSGSAATLRPASSMANLTGSVSGMNLYIPPYGQPGRTPSPQPPALPTQLPPSTSFAELGLPPGYRTQTPGGPVAAQTGLAPASHVSPTSSSSHLDALIRPMTAMSLGLAHTQRPAPPPAQPYESHSVGHSHHHRHSVAVPPGQDAPWAPLMPQTQQATPPPPQQRPHSASYAPWDQTRAQEDQRRWQAATPLPRPVSSQSIVAQAPPGQPYYPPPSPSHAPADYRTASPLPPSLVPGQPPPVMPHSQSTSHLHIPGGSGYRQPSPAPQVPPTSASAPPAGHYQIPTSSFSGIAQQPDRATTPRPYQPQPPAPVSHGSPYGGPPTRYHTPAPEPAPASYPPQQGAPQQSYAGGPHDPYAAGPSRRESTPQPPPIQTYDQQYHNAPPRRNSFNAQPAHGTSSGPVPPPITSPTAYAPPQASYPPDRAQSQHTHRPSLSQSLSSSAMPGAFNGAPASHTLPEPAQRHGLHQSTDYGPPPNAHALAQHYGYDSPHGQPTQPAPSHTPAPATATGGYVPWYQQTQTPAAPPAPLPTQRPPPQSHHDQGQPQHDPYASPAYANGQYRPVPNPPAPARQGVGYYPSDELYALQQQQQQQQQQQAPAPAPGPAAPWEQGYAAPAPAQPYNAPAPAYGQAQQVYQPPYPQSQHSPGPPISHTPAPTGPSPYAPTPGQASWSQSHTAAYARAPSPTRVPYGVAPDGWQSTVAPSPVHGAPPQHTLQHGHPLATPIRTPSPLPPAAAAEAGGNRDWRSYLQNLGAGASPAPDRAPSPQPPPKDRPYQSAPQQQQQEWYTPPPSLPASVHPQNGWRP